VTGYHSRGSLPGIVCTSITAAVMFALAAGKTKTGRQLGNPVLIAEGRVTVVDGVLFAAVLFGLSLNASLGWWRADRAAGFVIVCYAVKEALTIRASTAQH
jgi:divalent metal cation (Fe/Co/Zn/Cd) transporter